jgi:hypothetical protein
MIRTKLQYPAVPSKPISKPLTKSELMAKNLADAKIDDWVSFTIKLRGSEIELTELLRNRNYTAARIKANETIKNMSELVYWLVTKK